MTQIFSYIITHATIKSRKLGGEILTLYFVLNLKHNL